MQTPRHRSAQPARRILAALAAGALAVVCGAARAADAAPGKELTLVKDGAPAATIVLAKEPTRAAQFAAFELQHHVQLMTQAVLPIVADDETAAGVRILVGDSAATQALGLKNDDFASQEYVIRFGAGTLVLMGRDKDDRGKVQYDYVANANASASWPSIWDEQGTMYAVEDFLRDNCGVRWFNPTDVGTVAPKTSTLTVKGNEVRRKPFMWYRGGTMTSLPERVQWGGGLWRSGTPEGQAYMDTGYPAISGKYTNANSFRVALRSQNTLFMLRQKGGGEQAPCNHSFYPFYERFWNKESPNFESYHPEFFAQGYQGKEPPQMCYTNEGFIKQVVADIRDYFDHGGYQKRWSTVAGLGYKWGRNFYALEPMDNSAFCHCPTCTAEYELDRPRAEQYSTYWFRFVNRIAAEIAKSHPDKKLLTLAYASHEGLPTNLTVAPNVIVYFCISGNRMPYSPLLDRQLGLLKKWHENTKVPMSLWLYNTFPLEIANNGKFFCFPGFFAHDLDKQFKIYRDYGVNGIFHCGYNGEVANYLCYRLMDNPDANVDDLLNDYFSSFYGPAGPAIQKFYTIVEQRYCDPANYPKQGNEPYNGHQNVRIAWKYLGTKAVMDQLAACMTEAHAKAVTPEQKTRVQLWDEGVYQYMKAGYDTYNRRMAAPIPSVTAPRVADAGGDPNKVAWDQAAMLVDKMYDRGSDTVVPFKVDGRICHDGKYLYMELVDHCDTSKINVSPQIACYDDWEVMFAGQRAQPFRQYMFGPTAMTQGLSYGEVNWRQGVVARDYTAHAFGVKAVSDTSGGAWVLRMAYPLDQILEHPVKPGETLYSNLIRVRGPELNKSFAGGFGIESWVSYMTVKEVDRAGAITLAK